MKLVVNSHDPFALPQIVYILSTEFVFYVHWILNFKYILLLLCIDKHQCMRLNNQKHPFVVHFLLQNQYIRFQKFPYDWATKAPNDTAYMRSGVTAVWQTLCKLCRPLPAMRTHWMAGNAPHKSGQCRD